MYTNSTDFVCLVTRFLTDYLPYHRCYSKNTILSYKDTLKLFFLFLNDAKGISPNSFYTKDFKRELVIEFLEWYRNSGTGISAANQRLAALKAFNDYAQLEKIEYIAPLQKWISHQTQNRRFPSTGTLISKFLEMRFHRTRIFMNTYKYLTYLLSQRPNNKMSDEQLERLHGASL